MSAPIKIDQAAVDARLDALFPERVEIKPTAA
jgi:hypothetical protein